MSSMQLTNGCLHRSLCRGDRQRGARWRSLSLRCNVAGAAAGAAAAAAEDQSATVQQLLTRRSYAPPRCVGPIQVAEVPGKRYGLTATQNLPVGALLLVVPPLVAAFGPQGSPPSNAELVFQLDGLQLSPWQLQWLRLLYREPQAVEPAAAKAAAAPPPLVEDHAAAGAATSSSRSSSSSSSGSGSGCDSSSGRGGDTAAVAGLQSSNMAEQQQQQQAQEEHSTTAELQLPSSSSSSNSSSRQLALLQQLLLQGDAHASNAAAAAASTAAQLSAEEAAAAAAAAVTVSSVSCPFSADQLVQIISENAYAEPSEDLGAALLRELDPEGITGLWPEYALLNHSCAPNTVAVVVGQYLLLRAVAPIMSGEELTGSYLGALGFGPVALRRAYLSGVYGFHCQCDRCMTEQSTFPTSYYPADNEVLGIDDPNKPSSSSTSSKQDQQQGQGWLNKALGVLGLRNSNSNSSSSSSSNTQRRPQPSKQHLLLLQLHTEAAELEAAVQDAVTADNRRQERQLVLLQQITEKIDGLLEAVDDMLPQLQESSFVQSPQVAARWLLAAVYPLLQLQVEVLQLLLSSGELPVDDKHLLCDEVMAGSSADLPFSGSSRAMAAAGAAAAARLSLSRRSQPQGSVQGPKDWLSGWGFRPEQDAGPVTKRQLLGLYVEALERSLQVVDSVGRGSEAHVVLALQHMDATRQLYGVDSQETRLAEGLCSRAHAARYGVMKGEKQQQLLAALVSARRRQLLGASLARKMSVLAWETAVARE